MKIAPDGIRKAFKRGVQFARRGDEYVHGFRDGLRRAADEINSIIMRSLQGVIDVAYTRGREAGRAEAREQMGEMAKKAYEAGYETGRADMANAITPEALKEAGERALALADLEEEARDAQKH